jgi:HSP20 family molecular chaperone IbpA
MFNKSNDRYFTLDQNGVRSGIGLDIALPGYTKESISISVTKSGIKIESKGVNQDKGSREYVYRFNRIDQGPFSVEYSIPEICDLNKISASFENGILSIKIPIAEQKTRSIKIM